MLRVLQVSYHMGLQEQTTDRENIEGLDYLQCNSVSIAGHSMGALLRDYIAAKIHPDIRDGQFSRVLIRHPCTRASPERIPQIEKTDKRFNWQRPTTTIIDPMNIQLNCFPGKDYLRHYASMIALYYKLENRACGTVQYSIPSEADSMELFFKSNLTQMGLVDIAVVGYVEHLGLEGRWEGGYPDQNHTFEWQKLRSSTGLSVSFLGCMISFRGDTAGNLVRVLQNVNKVRCVVYIGKTGALFPNAIPNRWLTTGNCSVFDGKVVQWDNVLDSSLWRSSRVHKGTHITVPTPLCETKSWLNEWESRCGWVDCEVGHMAQASNESKTAFAYLHIVSDNVVKEHVHNLTNERLEEVIKEREGAFRDIRSILDTVLSTWSHTQMPHALNGPKLRSRDSSAAADADQADIRLNNHFGPEEAAVSSRQSLSR